MINDAKLEKVLDWLTASAKPAAQARANRIYVEEYRKTLKALLMQRSELPSVAAQEVAAYAHPEYQEHLKALREAVEQDETYRWRLTAAEASIEIWRSENANRRTAEKIT
jgi:hypothetical protein